MRTHTSPRTADRAGRRPTAPPPRWRLLFRHLLSCAALLVAAMAMAQDDASPPSPDDLAVVLAIDGPIGTGLGGYVTDGIGEAAERGADFVILTMNTPGGLDGAMRDIIRAILASPVPVVSYVYPNGARAASAGTYILYASHVAAMAPATNTGSATPVSLGGGGSWLQDDGARAGTPPADGLDADGDDDTDPDAAAGAGNDDTAPATATSGAEDDDTDSAAAAGDAEDDDSDTAGTAMERKVLNDAVAYIRSLAELRGRNADWAEAAVREAANVSAREALERNVIDLVADDLDDLLRQLDGRTVTVDGGTEVTFATADTRLERIEPDWRARLLETITRPEVAYLLLLVGIYGLLFEGYNPGALVPGIVGGICLLTAAYALQVLPVNFAGLGLIALGIALLLAEAFAPSFGVLGIGGLVAFVFGSVMLMDSGVPGFDAPIGYIAATATAAAGLTFMTVWMALRARRRPAASGVERMLIDTGVARGDFDAQGNGVVHIEGEDWTARTRPGVAIRDGDPVRVDAVHGLCLEVSPQKDRPSQGDSK